MSTGAVRRPLLIDGQLVGHTGDYLALAPGDHLLRLCGPSQATLDVTFSVAAGQVTLRQTSRGESCDDDHSDPLLHASDWPVSVATDPLHPGLASLQIGEPVIVHRTYPRPSSSAVGMAWTVQHVRVTITSALNGIELLVDGAPITTASSMPITLVVTNAHDMSTIVIVARRQGYASVVRRVLGPFTPNDSRTIDCSLTPLPVVASVTDAGAIQQSSNH